MKSRTKLPRTDDDKSIMSSEELYKNSKERFSDVCVCACVCVCVCVCVCERERERERVRLRISENPVFFCVK